MRRRNPGGEDRSAGGNTDGRCRSTRTRTKALKTNIDAGTPILGRARRAHRISRLGREKANRWEQTSRGHAGGDEPSGLCERNKSLKGNPTSATGLKMVGRRGEEQVAERPKKPVSGTVAGGVGPAGGALTKVGEYVDSPCFMR
jgi:hypothetical protein